MMSGRMMAEFSDLKPRMIVTYHEIRHLVVRRHRYFG